MGHVKNNEAKVWQNGHETWKMNPHFHAAASFFPSHTPRKNTQSSTKHTRTEQIALICRIWGCFIIFDMTLMSGLTAQLYTVSNPHNKTRQYRAVLTQLAHWQSSALDHGLGKSWTDSAHDIYSLFLRDLGQVWGLLGWKRPWIAPNLGINVSFLPAKLLEVFLSQNRLSNRQIDSLRPSNTASVNHQQTQHCFNLSRIKAYL